MLKKLVLMSLSFILLTVQASAGTNQGLSQAIEELNYNLTVEWDQKDKTFYDKQMTTFSTTISDLQAKGLTNQQLIDHVVSSIKDQTTARDVEATFNLVQINRMTPLEAQRAVKDLMGQSYNQGASWTGGVAEGIVAVAVLAIIAYAIVYSINSSCVKRCEKDCSILGSNCTEDCGISCN